MKNISNFLDFKNKDIINEIDKIIKNLESKREEKKNLDSIKDTDINNLRCSMPINYTTKIKLSSDNNENSIPNFSKELSDNKNSFSQKEEKKEKSKRDEEIERKRKSFLKNIYSTKILFNNRLNLNSNQDEDDKDEKNFFRFSSKKSATFGASNVNNLEIKLFNYQEEQEDNNFITKKKKSKAFLNFIDIDLFLQYIASGKKFYEDIEENNNLIEGFCLQYQTFIFPETLIHKVISCFNYFYSLYLNKDFEIIEEKSEDEEEVKEESIDSVLSEDEDDEDQNIIKRERKKAFKMTKIDYSNSEESEKKIPFGLIDFLYTFINFHNIYNHNELPKEVISKIYKFLKRLNDINEIKEKYEQKIALSEIELKEYEASFEKIQIIEQKNAGEKTMEDLSSSDDFSFEKGDEEKNDKIEEKEENDKGKKEENVDKVEKEEKEEKEKKENKEEKEENQFDVKKEEKENYSSKEKREEIGLYKKAMTLDFNNNRTFKLSSSKTINQNDFLNIYIEKEKITKKSTKIITEKVVKNSKNSKKDDKKDDKKEQKEKKNEKEKDEIMKKEGKEKPFEFDILKYKTSDIVSELTRVNYSLFSKIKVKEFLKGAFNGKDKNKLSPYICKIIKRFNTLSSWVTEEILSYDHAVKRAQILLKFLRICVGLKKIGDFDDCLSILSGITNFNISKLHKTWGHIPPEDMSDYRSLQKMLSFDGNWKYLRKEIDKRIKEKSFFIPYLGYYTKRMIFLEEMGPYIKKNTSLINIEKIVEVYKVLKSFYQIKNVKCKYGCHDGNIRKELSILQCLEPANEELLFQTSNLLEPKFILSNKKLNQKRRSKTDINFINNINKVNII